MTAPSCTAAHAARGTANPNPNPNQDTPNYYNTDCGVCLTLPARLGKLEKSNCPMASESERMGSIPLGAGAAPQWDARES